MADTNWKDRLTVNRYAAQARIEALSGVAQARIEALSSEARDRIALISSEGSKVAARGKTLAERAMFESRGLIAERPLVAVAAGVAAGVVLGFLANRLARQRVAEVDDETDNGDSCGA